MRDNNAMKFDDIIAELGEFGPYQQRIYYLVCLGAIPSALQTMLTIFVMGHQDHRCAIPKLTNDTFKSQGAWHDLLVKQWVPWDDDEDDYSSCKLFTEDASVNNTTHQCSRYVYDTDTFETTVLSDFEIVCGDKTLKTYANMIYMGGLLFGSLLLGTLSDILGRRKVLLISVFGHAAVNIGIVFVTSFIPYVLLRFFTAFFSVGTYLVLFVVGMEIVGPSKRKFAGIIFQLFWTIGLFILALLAYFIREWKYLHLACAFPTCLLMVYVFVMPESPRWLIHKRKFDEARNVLERAAKGNGVTLSEKAINLSNVDNEQEVNGNIWQMFTHKTLLVRTLVIFFNWIVASLVYYGLSLNVGALSGNIYLNYTLSSLIEGASYIFCLVFLDRWGRKPMQCSTMLVAGIACLCTIFPAIFGGENLEWVTMILSLVGKFGASAAFAIIFIYSAELFPTPLRNSGMGVSSFLARIGGIAAPYIGDLSDYVDAHLGIALPLIIFGGSSVVAGLLALLLPETTNMILPDSIADAKTFGKNEAKKNTYALQDVTRENEKKEKAGTDNPSFSY